MTDEEFAALITANLSGKNAGEYLWPGSWVRSRAGAAMIKAALEAAGVPYQASVTAIALWHD